MSVFNAVQWRKAAEVPGRLELGWAQEGDTPGAGVPGRLPEVPVQLLGGWRITWDLAPKSPGDDFSGMQLSCSLLSFPRLSRPQDPEGRGQVCV